MIRLLLKSSIIFAVIVGILFSSLAYTLAHASPDAVTVTSTNTSGKTILQITNNPSSASNVVSFTLEIKTGSFLSFKLENGWVGKKTSPSAISFISSNPIKPGDSTAIEIRTDQQSPDLVWHAFDANNNEISTGEIGAPPTSDGKINTGNNTGKQNTSKTLPTRGILDASSFRIIPSTPSPGYDIRVVGQNFAASSKIDMYIGNQKIDSFSSDSNGNFVATTTIPQAQQPGNAVFILKDLLNNQKTFTAAIQPVPNRSVVTVTNLPLSVNTNPIYHRGDTQVITGNATGGSTVTVSIEDPSGTSITTFTAKTNNKGTYSVSYVIPVDRAFGKYSVMVSDGKNQVSQNYSVVSTHRLSISTSQLKYNPGDTVVINGTSIANAPVSIVINDPTGNQIFAKDINVTSEGKISVVFPLSSSAIEGTYILTASQNGDEVPYYFGIGIDPVAILQITLNKLNYAVNEKPILNISGEPSSTLNLVVVDPSDKEKFSDTVILGPDGLATYSFNLTSYTPGIYSAVLTRGNDKAVKDFAVGLQTGCGQISMRTVKTTYLPDDTILIFGNANQDCIIQLTLLDPNGIPVHSEQAFTDKNGIFFANDFRIPGGASSGVWKLDASSGINHKSIDLPVRATQEMTVQLDNNPPNYSRGDIVQIAGSGAGMSLDVAIKILDSNNTLIDTLHIQSTNRGDYSTDWSVPTTLNIGTYTVQVQTTAGKTSTTMKIQ